MDIIETFEYPLPQLHIDLDKIVIETSANYEGSFQIRNNGGGELKGKILSNSKAILFSPESFSGKNITIFYTLDLSIYKSGDIIQTSVVIISSGGEKSIPVIIKVTPHAILPKEGDKIISLRDFYNYAKKYPVSARQIFMSHEFTLWLYAIRYEHMDMFEYFLKDANKERALDNFFIVSKLKKKTKLQFSEKKICITSEPYPDKQTIGSFTVIKNSFGYIDCKIIKKLNSKFITLDKEKITSSDFDENGSARINYYINPKDINENFAIEEITLENQQDECVTIMLQKKPIFSAFLSKEIYSFDDSGEIILTNYSGKELYVDILPIENFIKLEGRRYYISEYAKISFQIKVSPFLFAQLSFKKQPIINSEIDIRVNHCSILFRKKLLLQIGSNS